VAVTSGSQDTPSGSHRQSDTESLYATDVEEEKGPRKRQLRKEEQPKNFQESSDGA
jgi:hypothetical protein